jgi:hypothetical protein
MKGYYGFASKEAYEAHYSDIANYAEEVPAMEAYTRETMAVSLPNGFALAEFKPCVFYVDGLKVTEILLEDTCTVWVPWGRAEWGHAVDCGYSTDGRLIGMRIWDDVRTRKGT